MRQELPSAESPSRRPQVADHRAQAVEQVDGGQQGLSVDNRYRQRPDRRDHVGSKSGISIETERHFVPREQRCAPIVGARNSSQPHSQEARVGRLVPIVIVTAIDIFYRLGDLVGVLPDIVQRGDGHCVELTSG
jgi:hypothetical protein